MAVPSLGQAFTDFVAALQARNPRTRITYTTGARMFVATCADVVSPFDLEPTCLEDFYSELRRRGLKDPCARTYVSGAAVFLRFLEQRGWQWAMGSGAARTRSAT